VKERPILFSAPMVKALLAGTKRQTRRIMKPQPSEHVSIHGKPLGIIWPGKHPPVTNSRDPEEWLRECPYGVAGDRLWVRETWYDDFERAPGEANEMNIDRFDDGRVEGIEYRATHDCSNFEAGCPCDPEGDGKRSEWRPSIFMPRWASRLTLEVIAIRVERLQDISEADARAEGIASVRPSPSAPPVFCVGDGENGPYFETARDAYAVLWDAINAERATWKSNPFVWTVEFRELEIARAA